MLKFLIGVGIHSVPGAAIELALQSQLRLDEFDIIPIREDEYAETDLYRIFKNCMYFAERVRSKGSAQYYVGVTSGVCRFRMNADENKKIEGRGRLDVFVTLSSAGKFIDTGCLNPTDAQWQITNKTYRRNSHPESVSRFSLNLMKRLESGVSG